MALQVGPPHKVPSGSKTKTGCLMYLEDLLSKQGHYIGSTCTPHPD